MNMVSCFARQQNSHIELREKRKIYRAQICFLHSLKHPLHNAIVFDMAFWEGRIIPFLQLLLFDVFAVAQKCKIFYPLILTYVTLNNRVYQPCTRRKHFDFEKRVIFW